MTEKRKLLDVQSNVSNSDNSNCSNDEELFTVKKIDDTPFAVLNKNGELKLLMGNILLSNKVFSSEDEINEYIGNIPWDVIFSICIYICKNIDTII